ncbi:hypothetical protein AMTRI_Chr02g220320 [Amborella trichopoda]
MVIVALQRSLWRAKVQEHGSHTAGIYIYIYIYIFFFFHQFIHARTSYVLFRFPSLASPTSPYVPLSLCLSLKIILLTPGFLVFIRQHPRCRGDRSKRSRLEDARPRLQTPQQTHHCNLC